MGPMPFVRESIVPHLSASLSKRCTGERRALLILRCSPQCLFHWEDGWRQWFTTKYIQRIPKKTKTSHSKTVSKVSWDHCRWSQKEWVIGIGNPCPWTEVRRIRRWRFWARWLAETDAEQWRDNPTSQFTLQCVEKRPSTHPGTIPGISIPLSRKSVRVDPGTSSAIQGRT